jgi:hemin uptake protein HemP
VNKALTPALSGTARPAGALPVGTATVPQDATADRAPQRPPQLDSQEVLRGHPAVAIHHNGALYRLQTTRQGKLILTK